MLQKAFRIIEGGCLALSASLYDRINDIERSVKSLSKHLSDTLLCLKPLEGFLHNLASIITGISVVNIDVDLLIPSYPPEPLPTYYDYGFYDEHYRTINIFIHRINSLSDLIRTLLYLSRYAIHHKILGNMFLEEYNKAEIIFGYEKNPFRIDAINFANDKFQYTMDLIKSRIGDEGLEKLGKAITCIGYYTNKIDKLFYSIYENIHMILEKPKYEEAKDVFASIREEKHDEKEHLIRVIELQVTIINDMIKSLRKCCDGIKGLF